MTILGIDPGSRRMGCGVIRFVGGKIEFVAAETIDLKIKTEAEALSTIRNHLTRLIKRYKPTHMALEKLFFGNNQKTGIQVAQARGVALGLAHEHKLCIKEYTPTEVKQGVTGYGRADKASMIRMVRIILRRPNIITHDDEADALAVAIIAAHRLQFEESNKF